LLESYTGFPLVKDFKNWFGFDEVTVIDSASLGFWTACISHHITSHHITWRQVDQLSQRDRAAVWVSFGPKWKTIFCIQYWSIFNHYDVIGLQSYRIRWNKAK